MRQIAHRARSHVAARRPRVEVNRAEQRRAVARFLAARDRGLKQFEKAGFQVKLESLPIGDYYTIVLDDQKAHEMMSLGWGADWPNASTVIPPLFTPYRIRELTLPNRIVVQPFSWAWYFANAKMCKLYDYTAHQWTDFDGRPTTQPVFVKA